MPTATVTVKGQITIPKKIRDYLKIHTGDNIDFIVEPNGQVVMRRASIEIEELEGILRRATTKRLSVEEMNRVIRKKAASQK